MMTEEELNVNLQAQLAADPMPVPAKGLSASALAAVAHYAVKEGHWDATKSIIVLPQPGTVVQPQRPRQPAPASDPTFSIRRRVDLIVAVCLAFVAVGLGLSGIQKLRANQDVKTCQNQLRNLYTAAEDYAGTHGGRYPQVGTPEAPQAGHFVTVLSNAGTLPDNFTALCPSGEPTSLPSLLPVSYTYTLGYQTPQGTLLGLRRPDANLPTQDLQVLAADFPTRAVSPTVGPYSGHSHGMNVLFAGGHVQFVRNSSVGIDGDDVFRNALGKVAAGVSVTDSCLGRPMDRP